MHQWNQEEKGSGQASFQNMKSILTNKHMSLGVRKRVLQCYIEPILLYGCESWSMTKQTLTSIEAMEMWFLRRMLRVSWTEMRTNLEILNTARSTRKLISNVKRRQAGFLGHVMRKGKLEHLLTTGKIEGKRSRGRQRIKIQDGIAAWLWRSTAEMFVDARDREKWKVMIAYACNRHGNWGRRRCVTKILNCDWSVFSLLMRRMSLTRTHHATVVGPIRFSNRSNNCRVGKINERRSSLVRTHHAIFVFLSSLRPTKDESRMVCAGLKKTLIQVYKEYIITHTTRILWLPHEHSYISPRHH